MGRRPKGSNTASKSPADVARQSTMSSFFQPQVSPMFQKPQSSRGAGGSAEAGVGGSANADRGSAAASGLAGAAGRGGAESETIVVVDDDAGVAGDVTGDAEATESEPDASSEQQQSSTDTEANCLHKKEPCTEVKLLLLTRPWPGLIDS
eukprot:1452124-Rhodomonas_salina.1